MTVFAALLAPVMPILEDIEQARRKHGNETFRWLDFVQILIFYFTERCGSRNALVIALENADPALGLRAVPAMTITDAFERFSPSLLRQALSRLITQVDRPVIPELALIGAIDAVDGSYFPVMGGMSVVRDGDCPRIKLHLDFRVTQLLVTDFVIDTATSSERQALRKMLRAGTTYVLDRGYMAFTLLRDAIAAEAHVIMRAYTNLVVETIDDLPVGIPQPLIAQWTEVRDRRVRSAHDDAEGLVFRLVEFTVGSTSYKLITDRFDLSTFQVILIYAYRWQIELVFRFFKHTMHGMRIITQSHWGIENYFAAMFLTALLHIQFKDECLQIDGHHAPQSTEQGADTPQPRRTKAVVSRDQARPSTDGAVASFLAQLNTSVALFWKIPKHWLTTLADYLHRLFTSDVVAILNKRALADFKPK